MNIFNLFIGIVSFFINLALIYLFYTPVTTIINLFSGSIQAFLWIGWFMMVMVMIFVIPIYFATSEDATKPLVDKFGRN